MSPWVATTRFSLVATMTLHPVPQKRHGALSHFSSLASRSVTRLAASDGTGMPPASAAMAAASSLSSWRRSSFPAVMATPCNAGASAGVDGVKDERGGVNVGKQGDGVERGSNKAGIRGIYHHDELALRVAAVNFATRQCGDRRFHLEQAFRPCLNQNARDFSAGWREDAILIEKTPGYQGAAIDC